MDSDEVYKARPVPDLYNWNTDRTVEPFVMVRGLQGRTSAGNWVPLLCTSGGYLTITNTP